MTRKPKIDTEIELVPDAWERFERVIETAAKIGPKHRVSSNPYKPKSRVSRLTKPRKARKAGD